MTHRTLIAAALLLLLPLPQRAPAAPPQTDNLAAKALLGDLGEGFNIFRTDHFVVAYDTEAQWARDRARLLESCHRKFHERLGRIKIKPAPLGDRLPCIFFQEYGDYLAYAEKIDKAKIGWAGGYYSPRTNRAVFFNDNTNPKLAESRRKIAELEERIPALQARFERSKNPILRPRYKKQLFDARSRLFHAKAMRAELASAVYRANAAKTTHEAAHQLAYNTGVHQRGVMAPFWFREGFATQFEGTPPFIEFGPGTDNPGRRIALAKARVGKRLAPLAEFVVQTQVNTKDIAIGTAQYGQAWGLFRFLFEHHPTGLARYIQIQSQQKPGGRRGDELRAEFEAAFGPIRDLEPAWTEFAARFR